MSASGPSGPLVKLSQVRDYSGQTDERLDSERVYLYI